MSTSDYSRRSLVTTAAVVAPVLALPAVASAGVLAAGADDSELLKLGGQLLRANRVLDVALASYQDEQVDDAMHRIAALMPPIFSLTATTRDGLAVQAAAAAIACRELWDDVGEWSTSDNPSWEVERPFIEAVCRFTGVAHPVVPDAASDAAALDHSTELASTAPDPIFAAIEAHKRVHLHKLKVCSINFATDFSAPEKPNTDAADDAARTATEEAERHLSEIRPTTLAGVIALLAYADDFCTQKFALPGQEANWHSSDDDWMLGLHLRAGLKDRYSGEPVHLSTLHCITTNALNALRTLSA